MTRKHFQAAADMIADIPEDSDDKTVSPRVIAAGQFAAFFQQFNPRFDKNRFFKACELRN